MQNNIEYLFIDENSDLYDATIELRYNEFFKQFNRPKETIFDEFENSSYRLVACKDKKVIGHVRLIVEECIGELSQVVVDKDYRNLNIGAGLINGIIELSYNKNIDKLVLESRMYAVDFYKKFGFNTLGDVFASKRTGLPNIKMERKRL